MQRISISELSSLRWSFHQDVIRYASQGFDSIGIWRQKIDDFDIFETADFLLEMQMNVSSVHWASGFTGGEGLTHVEAINDAIEAIHTASHLGADSLIVHPGCRNGHTRRHAQRLFSQALETLLPVAEDSGVTLAIEPMPCPSASAWTFMDTLESSLDLINEFDCENLGLVLDLYHVGLNADVIDNLEKYIPRLALVQLADRKTTFSSAEKRMLLGAGHVPLDHWFGRLQELGYTGQYEIELHGISLLDTPYADMLSSVSRFFKQESVRDLLHSSPSSEKTPQQQLRRSSNQ